MSVKKTLTLNFHAKIQIPNLTKTENSREVSNFAQPYHSSVVICHFYLRPYCHECHALWRDFFKLKFPYLLFYVLLEKTKHVWFGSASGYLMNNF